jgi:hypothetical protein
MNRILMLKMVLAVVIALAVAEPALAMRDAGGPAGPYGDGMHLYQYAASAPPRYVDPTGNSPEEIQTLLTTAYNEVRYGNWQAAQNAMEQINVLREKGESPTPTKACCCTGENAKKCHIAVRHLGRVSSYFLTSGGVRSVPATSIGFPPFPPRTGSSQPTQIAVSGETFVAGVVTLVYIVHDEGKDTTGCILKADVEDRHWSMDGTPTDGNAENDFGIHPFRFKGNLNTSQGWSWYIDTPIFPAPIPARFFQMHVQIMDKDRSVIQGPEAYYGWAYNARPNGHGTYGFAWKVWPENYMIPAMDPREKKDVTATMAGLLRN